MMRAAKVAIGVAAGLVVAAASVRAFMVWDRGRDQLPAFTEASGPRAPAGTNALFGVRVGESKLADIDAFVVARAIPGCRDTSMRALMQGKRDDVSQQMAAAAARGDDPDGVTGASLATYRSKKERNPQVRLSCEPVPGDAFGDRPRGSDAGRLLMVLDSADHPVRHVSFARKIDEPAGAFDAWSTAVAAMQARFGRPTSALNGEPDLASPEPFPRLKIFKKEWRLADLRAEVTAMSFGARGIDVKETLEVPWPVRADAPALTR